LSTITGMNHVALNCNGKKEMDEVVNFYCNVLGFKKTAGCYVDGLGNMAMIDTGTGSIELWDNADPKRGDGVIGHLALTVENADEAVEIFRKEGLPVDSEPVDLVLDTEPKMNIRVAFVRGKAGESIEIFQER
jgi:catechol 2,3-dioxygenase-like lactoylglutathione lyase family enzyme